MISDDKKMMEYWDYKNNIYDPHHLKRTSNRKIRLICPKCGFMWETRARETKRCNCPCCDDNKVLVSGVNDIATLFPNITKELLEELNPDFDINKTKINSKEYVTWKCFHCGKIWKTQFKSRIRKNQFGYYLMPCPSCSRKQIPTAPKNYNLEKLFPNIAKQLSTKNSIEACKLFPYSKQKMIWTCENGHEWEDTIKNRTILGRGCKICSNYKTPFFTLFPNLRKNYSYKNTLSLSEVTKWSKQKAIWNCNNGHELSIRFCDITENKGIIKCKYCDNLSPSPGETSLFDTYPTLQNEWCKIENSLLGIEMNQIFPSSEKVVFWECKNHHKYPLMVLKRINYLKRNREACPYCKGLIRKKDKIL